MSVYVVGGALHRAAARLHERRLEEIAYATARAALDEAGVRRDDLDHVTSLPATTSMADRFRPYCLPRIPVRV